MKCFPALEPLFSEVVFSMNPQVPIRLGISVVVKRRPFITD
jgi:hypothetical protein